MENNCGGSFTEPRDEPNRDEAANGSEKVTGSNCNVDNEEPKEKSPKENNEINSSELGISSALTWPKPYHQYYKMDNSHRGVAIIFNHYILTGHEKPRTGTYQDANRLKMALYELGFDVKSYTDLTFQEICAVVEKARKENYEDMDCFILSVLTHGDLNGVLEAKDTSYYFSTLWEPFTDDHCPSLSGKPRLFFVQACRGDKVMDPVQLISYTHTDSISRSPIPNIPQHFLVAYSTCEGHFSFRSKSGTPFIQNLCNELEQHGYDYDLNYLLTQVLRKVAIDFESNCPDEENVHMHEKKQMPCIVTKLTRLLRFQKKV